MFCLFSEKSYSGKSVLLQGVECGIANVPLHHVFLTSDLVSGFVTVGVRSSLPIDGVHFLLGNDLAGEKVIPSPVVTDKPKIQGAIDPILVEIPDLYPSCAVTRAMTQKAKLSKPPITNSVSSEYDLADTFLSRIFSDENNGYSDVSMTQSSENVFETLVVNKKDSNGQFISDTSQFSSNPSKDYGFYETSQDFQVFARENLIAQQKKDPEIYSLFKKALSEDEIFTVPVGYYFRNGVLMRKWRPSDVREDTDWSVKHKIVLPKRFRIDVLSFAHENPLSGHLGVTKTYHKLLNHFFWPCMKEDVSKFCKSCHFCQMVGKPNQKIPHAPLQPIPAFEEPFSRVLIDCVGPFPKSKSGNEYLLTIMCTSTRFPEAKPLRNI